MTLSWNTLLWFKTQLGGMCWDVFFFLSKLIPLFIAVSPGGLRVGKTTRLGFVLDLQISTN